MTKYSPHPQKLIMMICSRRREIAIIRPDIKVLMSSSFEVSTVGWHGVIMSVEGRRTNTVHSAQWASKGGV